MTAYFIMADLGKLGRETIIDWGDCSRESVILDLLRGEHDRPLEVHCIDFDDKTCLPVSEDIAREVLSRLDHYPTGGLLDYLEQHLGCEAMANVAREMEAA